MIEQVQALMLQGDQFLKENRLQDAQNCYLQVIAQQPSVSEAFFRLAGIANQQGQVLSARKKLKKAYDLQPENKHYLFGLTQLYLQTSKFDEAINCYQSYLKLDKSQDDVFFNYGCLLIQVNQFNEAIDALHKSIQLNPTQLSYYMKLGELLYNLLKYKDALDIYYKALERNLQSEGLYLNIAKMHVDSGDLANAQSILKQATEVYPESLVFAYRLSSLDKTSLNQDLLVQLKATEKQTLSNENQFYYLWLMALYAFQENDLKSELSFLLQAHSTYQKLGNFSETTEDFMNQLHQLSHASSEFDVNHAEPISDSSSPIFIVGIPRCGSTLIENIICAGPQKIIKGEETSAVLHALRQTNSVGNINWNELTKATQALYQKHDISQETLTFTDKSLENIFFIDLILALYPQAKIIYCDRAPLASIISILKNNMAVLPWAHDLDSIFQYVDDAIKAIEKAIQKYPEKILRIRYEELVTRPDAESQKIMSFCQLTWDKSCLAFHEKQGVVSKTASHLQIRKAINKEALDAYKQYYSFFAEYEIRFPWLTL